MSPPFLTILPTVAEVLIPPGTGFATTLAVPPEKSVKSEVITSPSKVIGKF